MGNMITNGELLWYAPGGNEGNCRIPVRLAGTTWVFTCGDNI